MAAHGALQVGPPGAGAELQGRHVQRVEPEEIAVRAIAFGWAGAAVTLTSEVIGSALAGLARPVALGERVQLLREVVQQPVIPGSGGRVGVVNDQSETL